MHHFTFIAAVFLLLNSFVLYKSNADPLKPLSKNNFPARGAYEKKNLYTSARSAVKKVGAAFEKLNPYFSSVGGKRQDSKSGMHSKNGEAFAASGYDTKAKSWNSMSNGIYGAANSFFDGNFPWDWPLEDLDSDLDQNLSLDYLSEEDRNNFLLFDENKDKELDAEELRRRVMKKTNDNEVILFFQNFDRDNSGTVSEKEYAASLLWWDSSMPRHRG